MSRTNGIDEADQKIDGRFGIAKIIYDSENSSAKLGKCGIFNIA
jgi:hypothetical protein